MVGNLEFKRLADVMVYGGEVGREETETEGD